MAKNWVSVNYFPTWTGFIARNTTNSTRAEVGGAGKAWAGEDTFALAAQYPYIQLERVGADFHFRVSADGVTFLPLTKEGGMYDGVKTPLVVNRPDLPETLQVGPVNATYDVTTGYAAFDDFSVVTPGPKVVWVSAMHPSTADANVPSDAGNGKVLAARPDNGNILIAEWGTGTPFYATSAQTPGGRRMFFNAGTQEISGQKTNWGVMNLNEEGKKIFLNAVAYMVARTPIAVAVENASFELPGAVKIKGWNGEGIGGTPAVDIPGWSSDKAVADSGVETGYTATDGDWTAFLIGADPSVWQLTDYVIDAEDVFELQVDARDTWQGKTLRMVLYYDEGGFRIPVAFVNAAVTGTMQTLPLTFDAGENADAVGKQIGIEFKNATTTGESWIGLDNVRLFDLEGR